MGRCILYYLAGIVATLIMLAAVGTAAYVSHDFPPEATISKPYQQVRVTVYSTEWLRGIAGGILYFN